MKAIIFDMDGVIIDSEPLHQKIERELLEELGGKITQNEHLSFIGTTDEYMWSTFKERFNLKPTVEEMVNTKKERFIKQIKEVRLVDGFKETIEKLSNKNYKLALASSNNRKAVNEIVAHFDLKQYFEVVMNGEDVENGKPAPDIFLKTAEKLEINPSSCLVIEDATNGVIAAKKAGMKCVGLDNPNSGEQDLSGADIVIDDYKEFDMNQINKLFN